MRLIFEHERAAIFHGDCRDLLEVLPECSVDAIVCDPPYLLVDKSGRGFMGADWDSVVREGSESVGRASERWHRSWCEVALRVLKPGGHMLAFGGSRTFHRMCSAIEDAGFELRDVLMFLYGVGYPKSLDVAKQRGVDPERWRGWGTALKPAYEPIALARKPPGGTVGECVARWGTGGIHVGACRVGSDLRFNNPSGGASGDGAVYGLGMRGRGEGTIAVGRWPANVMLAHHEDCRLVGTCADERRVRVGERIGDDSRALAFGMGRQATTTTTMREIYECHADCPLGIMDEQAGTRAGYGPSRFFYCSKPSRAEKDAGLDHLPGRSGAEITGREEGSPGIQNPRAGAGARSQNVKNSHTTVKSVALMRYLCRLVCPPGGTVLDVFAGSGTTGVAAIAEGFSFVGCELGGDGGSHLPILVGRVRHALGLLAELPGGEPR